MVKWLSLWGSHGTHPNTGTETLLPCNFVGFLPEFVSCACILCHVALGTQEIENATCKVKKGQFHPRTGHEVLNGERGIALLSFILGSRWGCGQRTPRPLYPRKDPIPIVREAGWTPGIVWTSAENLIHTGIWSPNRPACNVSLCRLSYPKPRQKNVRN